MARELRIAYAGAFYHVMARGNEKKNIFKDARDRKTFLKLLSIQYTRHKGKIHAYCLMDNHYHLLLETPLPNISRFMQELQASYAMYFNQRYNRTGHFFQGRFKAKLVQTDAYLMESSRYVHMNPVRARLCFRPQDYMWSSYKLFIDQSKTPAWFDKEFTLSQIGNKNNWGQRISKYRQFVERENESKEFLDKMKRGIIIATNEFKEQIKTTYLKLKNDSELPGLKEFHDIPRQVKMITAVVDRCVHCPKEARKWKMYFFRKCTALPLKAIAGQFRGIGYAAVSMNAKRIEDRRGESADTERLFQKMKKMLNVKM